VTKLITGKDASGGIGRQVRRDLGGAMSTPLVSVVLPVRDGAAFVGQAISSILTQTLDAFELLVVDDGSRDATPAIIVAALDPRVRMLTQPGLGLVPALNRGLAEARGCYVARMDADDVAMPERFARQAAALDAHPNVAALGSACLVIGHDDTTLGHRNPPTEPAVIHAMLRQGNCMIHPTMMLRRAAVLDAGGYRPAFRLAEDFDLWLRLSERHDLMNLPECLLSYRQHAAQSSWQDVEQRALSELGALVVAEQRRAGMEDPAGRVPLVTRAFLQAIGVPEAAITRHITVRAMDAAKEAIAAGHRASARETIGLLLRQPGLHPRTRLHAWLLRLRS
jgi:glycosyltransferase involved in cell wall biosynthesis